MSEDPLLQTFKNQISENTEIFFEKQNEVLISNGIYL